LARREVPDEPHLAGRAERAGHRATGLRRNADGVARAVMRHEHGLDPMAIVELQQDLARLAIGARLLDDRLDAGPAERGGERGAQALREIGELAPVPRRGMRRVAADLLHPIAGLALSGEPRA